MASFKTKTALGQVFFPYPKDATVTTAVIDINWPDAGAGVAVGDVIELGEIPPGLDVLDWEFTTDRIDSNGTPTAAFTLGVLNAAKTAIGGGATDAWTAAGGINAGQLGGQNIPNGSTGANHFSGGRTARRTLGLVATAATATAALANKRACLLLKLRQ